MKNETRGGIIGAPQAARKAALAGLVRILAEKAVDDYLRTQERAIQDEQKPTTTATKRATHARSDLRPL